MRSQLPQTSFGSDFTVTFVICQLSFVCSYTPIMLGIILHLQVIFHNLSSPSTFCHLNSSIPYISNCLQLQVIDFGSSCYEHQRVYTYIQSRFYRAPEVILGARYGMPIDMWSLGCILAELLTGFPLLPGEDEADQLACIMELLGMPPQRLLEQSKRAKNFISSKGYPRYCTATTQADGTTVLRGGLSRRGKPRGPPGSKDLKRALKG